jgi:DNA-binding response OmpR family regulator
MQAIFIEQALAEQAGEVSVVENGKLALEKLEKTTYSAVILDGMMPVMEGVETLKAIPQIPRQKGQPVIMVTAMGSEDNIIRGYQYGANDYILKPFSEDQIVSRIKDLLSIAATG